MTVLRVAFHRWASDGSDGPDLETLMRDAMADLRRLAADG